MARRSEGCANDHEPGGLDACARPGTVRTHRLLVCGWACAVVRGRALLSSAVLRAANARFHAWARTHARAHIERRLDGPQQGIAALPHRPLLTTSMHPCIFFALVRAPPPFIGLLTMYHDR